MIAGRLQQIATLCERVIVFMGDNFGISPHAVAEMKLSLLWEMF
jgi:hypothetical protein